MKSAYASTRDLLAGWADMKSRRQNLAGCARIRCSQKPQRGRPPSLRRRREIERVADALVAQHTATLHRAATGGAARKALVAERRTAGEVGRRWLLVGQRAAAAVAATDEQESEDEPAAHAA